MVTRVDFYVSPSSDARERQLLACRLTEKAYRQKLKVYLKTESGEQDRTMDDLLWTFRAGSFVPHAIVSAENDPDIRVWLGHATAPQTTSDVLINLAADIPTNFDQFERIVELVDQNDTIKQAARERYRHYKQHGLELFTHTLQSTNV